jgi:PAP_fibrillin
MGFALADPASSLSHGAAMGEIHDHHETVKIKDENDVEQPRSEQQQHQHQVQAMNDDSPRSHLKAKVKSLLAKYNGCTKNSEVVDAINQLAELNPSTKGCARLEEFPGEFYTLTAPNFPGRIKPPPHDDSVVQYTLGRLSFNIFQPNKLVCTLRSVRNPVKPTSRFTKDGQRIFTYHFVLDITIHSPDGHDLPATMINEAECYESPDFDNRLLVSFTGGTLLPAKELVSDPSLLKLWSKTFEGAYRRADSERSYLGWFVHYIVKLLLGLTFPSDDDSNNEAVVKNSFHFGMQRSPVGYFDVLYLDGDLRITRGNRGTIVVVERS